MTIFSNGLVFSQAWGWEIRTNIVGEALVSQ